MTVGMDLAGRSEWVRRKPRIRETLETVAIAALLFIVLRTFVIQAFRIPSPSMEDTLLVGDFLFISKIEYGARVPFTDWRLPGWREPRPGDVVVFRFPGAVGGDDPVDDYIKRCVAVAGQTVEMRNKLLYVDGEPQVEPYVVHRDPGINEHRDNFDPLLVPAGHLFMLGDNRDGSNDSRFWGPLPMKYVHGRAFIRYFSWNAEAKTIRLQRLLTAVR